MADIFQDSILVSRSTSYHLKMIQA